MHLVKITVYISKSHTIIVYFQMLQRLSENYISLGNFTKPNTNHKQCSYSVKLLVLTGSMIQWKFIEIPAHRVDSTDEHGYIKIKP